MHTITLDSHQLSIVLAALNETMRAAGDDEDGHEHQDDIAVLITLFTKHMPPNPFAVADEERMQKNAEIRASIMEALDKATDSAENDDNWDTVLRLQSALDQFDEAHPTE